MNILRNFALISAACAALTGTANVIPAVPVIAAETAQTEGNCGEKLTWKLDSDKILTISGTGDMDDYYQEPLWVTEESLPIGTIAPWGNEIRAVIIEEGVTSIGSGAFSGCTALTSVTVTSTVTRIGSHAFESCSSLKEISLPDSISRIDENAFSRTALTALKLPDQLKMIGSMAFQSCPDLTEISIPEGTESIGLEAFAFCEKLESVKLADSLMSVGLRAFDETPWISNYAKVNGFLIENGVLLQADRKLNGNITVPNGVRIIAGGAFEYVGYSEDDTNSAMTVTLPEGVVSIGAYAFCWCSSMDHISLPSTLTVLEDGAFFNCFALKDIKLPENLNRIGQNAFGNCESLEKITIPRSVELIGCRAFQRCASLNEVTILNPNTEIGQDAETFTNGRFNEAPMQFTGVIRGYEGSTAQAYAAEFDRRFETIEPETAAVPGDTNSDSRVDVADAVLLAKFIAEDSDAQIGGEGKLNADVNKNGSLENEDITMILRYIAKLLPSFEE